MVPRHPVFPVILALLCGCAESGGNLASTAETSMSTLNAENDVYGLVVRYHAARARADEYRPLVQEAERERETLRRQLAVLESDLATLGGQVGELTTAKEAALAALKETEAARDDALAKLEETKAKIGALSKERDGELAALDALIARVKLLSEGQPALADRVLALEKEIQALRDQD